MNKRLYRSRREKVIGGVCGGIAEYYDVDPTIVRLATILLVLGLGFPVLAYLVGWIIIPRQPLTMSTEQPTGNDTTAQYPSESGQPTQTGSRAGTSVKKESSGISAMVPGIALVALGLFALLKGYFWWHWDDLLPVGLVVIGVYLILRHLDLTPSNRNGESGATNGVDSSPTLPTTHATNGGES